MALQEMVQEENEKYDEAVKDEKERSRQDDAAKKIQENYRRHLNRKDAMELSQSKCQT